MQLKEPYHNLKKLFIPLGILFSSVLLMLFLSIYFLGWMVWSIDGDKYDDSINISSDYYLDNSSRSLMRKIDKSWYKIVLNGVDSIGTQGSLIYGFADKKYFLLNTSTERVLLFQSKDSLGLIAVPELKSLDTYN